MLKRFFQITYKKDRVFGLDVFRSLAILTVILGHGKLIIRETSPEIAAIPLPNGVEIFFVLSGFLIGQIISAVMSMYRVTGSGLLVPGLGLLAVQLTAYALLTYYPPDLWLFIDSRNGLRGIPPI